MKHRNSYLLKLIKEDEQRGDACYAVITKECLLCNGMMFAIVTNDAGPESEQLEEFQCNVCFYIQEVILECGIATGGTMKSDFIWIFCMFIGGILLTIRGIVKLVVTLYQDGWFQ